MTDSESKGSALFCVSCSSDAVDSVGVIPSNNRFAGKELDRVIAGGNLYRCLACSLYYRFPRLSKDEMDALYLEGDDESWSSDVAGSRRDWSIASSWIQDVSSTNMSILDVGCFDGGFLSGIGGSFDLYGVEIHEKAIEIARDRGITILGSNFGKIDNKGILFDLVCAFDVVEHVADPLVFVKSLSDLVKPGGYMIISTGNTDSLTWKMMKSRYWYCAMTEHISFINKAWCDFAGQRLNLIVKKSETFSHMNTNELSVKLKVKQVIQNVSYFLFPGIFAFLRKKKIGSTKNIANHPEMAYFPPSWMSSKDHFVVLFQKPV